MTPLPAEAVARFAAALARLGGDTTRPIGLAVSGGADSTALLLLAHSAGLPIAAATVDHGLRSAAADEAAAVAALCASLGVPHTTLAASVEGEGEGVQAAARRARYALLGGWAGVRGIATLLTGHHADDQLETLLMRLARGSGLAGLRGVQARRTMAVASGTISLMRPLLGFRRAELRALVHAAGVPFVDDPSNDDPRFDRARVRAALAGLPWLDPLRADRSAAALAEAEAALAWATAQAATGHLRHGADGLEIDPDGLPAAILRRLLAEAIAALVPAPRARVLSGPRLDRALARLRAGEPASLGEVLIRPGARWRVMLAPPRRPPRHD